MLLQLMYDLYVYCIPLCVIVYDPNTVIDILCVCILYVCMYVFQCF